MCFNANTTNFLNGIATVVINNCGYQLEESSEWFFCGFADEKVSMRRRKALCFMGVDIPDVQQNSFSFVSVFSLSA